jgi:hypothetical protein
MGCKVIGHCMWPTDGVIIRVTRSVLVCDPDSANVYYLRLSQNYPDGKSRHLSYRGHQIKEVMVNNMIRRLRHIWRASCPIREGGLLKVEPDFPMSSRCFVMKRDRLLFVVPPSWPAILSLVFFLPCTRCCSGWHWSFTIERWPARMWTQ